MAVAADRVTAPEALLKELDSSLLPPGYYCASTCSGWTSSRRRRGGSRCPSGDAPTLPGGDPRRRAEAGGEPGRIRRHPPPRDPRLLAGCGASGWRGGRAGRIRPTRREGARDDVRGAPHGLLPHRIEREALLATTSSPWTWYSERGRSEARAQSGGAGWRRIGAAPSFAAMALPGAALHRSRWAPLRAALPLLARGEGKLARGIRGRREVLRADGRRGRSGSATRRARWSGSTRPAWARGCRRAR